MSDVIQLQQFKGSHNRYIDIGTRGQETLGLNLEYSSSEVGYFVFRFVVHSSTGKYGSFQHFSPRHHGVADFLALAADGSLPRLPDGSPDHSKEFKGTRLNKFGVPVFKPAVLKMDVLLTGDTFKVWEPLAEWVLSQMALEGFTPIVEDLPAALRSFFVLKSTDLSAVTLVLEFPDLAAHKVKQDSYKVHKPVNDDDDPDDDDPEDDEDDDENGDDTGGEKGWLQ